MRTQIIVAVIAAVAAVLGPFLQNRFRIDPRQSIERDLKIAEQLPDSSSAKQHLEEDIERRVQELAWQGKGKRAWGQGLFCLLTGAACIYGTGYFFYRGWSGSGWSYLWIVLSLVLFVFSLAFLNQVPGYFKKASRDKQENIISYEDNENGKTQKS